MLWEFGDVMIDVGVIGSSSHYSQGAILALAYFHWLSKKGHHKPSISYFASRFDLELAPNKVTPIFAIALKDLETTRDPCCEPFL